jgi:hypothetical protein
MSRPIAEYAGASESFRLAAGRSGGTIDFY